MERASGYSENSGMGMAVCPPVAFSELVSGISIASLQRTRFTVRTDPKKSRGELLGSFKAIVVLINRELTFWPVGSLREDQTHNYNVYEGVGRCNNVLLIFHLLLP